MSPTDKRNIHPAERLHVSNVAYKERFVRAVATRLAERHGASTPVPNLLHFNQNSLASWIATYFQRDEIAEAVHLVQSEIPHNEKIFRRGRPPGSRNRYSTSSGSSWEDELAGPMDRPMDAPSEPATPASDAPSLIAPPSIAPSADLSRYVLKTELEGHIQRIDTDVNNHVRSHSEAIKTYCELTFGSLEEKINNTKPIIVELHKTNLPTITTNVGKQHMRFSELITMCNSTLRDNSHINIWIHGPAGTGKSAAVKYAFEAMGIGFRTNGKSQYVHDLLGYMHGDKYISSQFREAFEHGHGYCADEIDSWAPDALVALNGALANGVAAFPDGLVKRHPNFLFVACGNTTGLGATIEYVGRFKQDAAFTDRCIYLDWPIDDTLEDHMCANKDWLRVVRHVRKAIQENGIKNILVTPRAAIYGESLLSSGLSLERTMISVLKKGMTDAQWANVIRGL